jgi:acetyl-CoA carboxylase carboxyl transferase subunit beta
MTSAPVTMTPSTTRSGPPAAWHRCPACASLLYGRRLQRALWVCPECDHHLRLPARERIAQLADQGSFTTFDLPLLAPDPLRFHDSRPYVERLGAAAEQSGESEGLVAGTARVGGHEVVLAVMSFDFLGGSMGREVGRRVVHAADAALERRVPLVCVCASGGARMQEGVLALAQMTRTSAAFGRLHEAGLGTVCILTDPTYGGVSASFATLGNVLLAERGAMVGFAGPRVVRQTIRQELPDGFQTAEFLLAHGLVDRVEHRVDLRAVLVRLLGMLSAGHPRPDAPPAPGGSVADPVDAPVDAPVEASVHVPVDAWAVVQAARDVNRPTTTDYLATVFDDFLELHGDRAYGDDPALVGGLASVAGRNVVVIGHQKGHQVSDLVASNFGMPLPEGYRKATRLLGVAEQLGLPVVTLVDTPGAHPGVDAEMRGQSVAIAQMLLRLSRLRTPVVSVVTGEGGSGGALALCSADRLLMLERSYLSVISPEGCAAILWRDAQEAPRAAQALHVLPQQLLELGFVTGIVPEPAGGAQGDPLAAASALRAAVVGALDELSGQDVDRLLDERARRLALLDLVQVGT